MKRLVLAGMCVLAPFAGRAGTSCGEKLPGASAQDLNVAGMKAYRMRDYREAADLFQSAVSVGEEHALAHYNPACTLALLDPKRGSAKESFNDSTRRARTPPRVRAPTGRPTPTR